MPGRAAHQRRRGDVDGAFEYLAKGKDTKGRADDRDLFEEGMGLLALATLLF